MRMPFFTGSPSADKKAGASWSGPLARRTLLQSAIGIGVAGGLSGMGGMTGIKEAAAQAPTTQPPALKNGLLGHSVVGGGSEAVLVLHEWMGDHTNYDGLLPFLDQRKFTYVFADLRGYGWSRHLTGAYTVQEVAGDVFDLMTSLGHQRFHAVGHSMTGMVVQYLAVRDPARIKSIVAVTPVPASGFKADETTYKNLLKIVDDDDAMRAAIRARVAKRYTEAWVNYKLALARRASVREAMVGYLNMFTGTDFAKDIGGVKQPVLAITGADDIPFYQAPKVKENFAAYQNFTLDTIHDAGHYPMLQTPALLLSKIEQFLAAQG